MFEWFKKKENEIDTHYTVKKFDLVIKIDFDSAPTIRWSGYFKNDLQNILQKINDQLKDKSIDYISVDDSIINKKYLVSALITEKVIEVSKEQYEEITGEAFYRDEDGEEGSSSSAVEDGEIK
jgi:hypothetical protein